MILEEKRIHLDSRFSLSADVWAFQALRMIASGNSEVHNMNTKRCVHARVHRLNLVLALLLRYVFLFRSRASRLRKDTLDGNIGRVG